MIVGAGTHPSEPPDPMVGYPMRVRLTFEGAMLPNLATVVHGDAGWRRGRPASASHGETILWPGALPAFAMENVEVDQTDRGRLQAMALHFRELGKLRLTGVADMNGGSEGPEPPETPMTPGRFEIPDSLDGILGGMHMTASAASVRKGTRWTGLEVLTATRSGTAS